MGQPSTSSTAHGEWSNVLAHGVAGLLLFETVSGLAILFLPFTVSTQITVLVHTVAGLAFLAPFIIYQVKHWAQYRAVPMSGLKLTGYLALLSTVVALVTGVLLTWQAWFGTRIDYTADLIHTVSTFALLASALPHVLTLVLRARRAQQSAGVEALVAAQRRYGRRSAISLIALSAVVVVTAVVHRPVDLTHELPEDYSYVYGEDRPFAPSLATTPGGEPFDERVLGGSASCGSAGCHSEIAEEWEVSAHRWAAMDVAFIEIQNVMAEQNGPESTRYCGGCHDPISLFSGSKNLFEAELTNLVGYDEGVSCLACHSITETDVQGNANYVMGRPSRYMFELNEGPWAKRISDFLIRAYPRQHSESLSHTLFKSPEFCAACHKQFIDEEINQVGWVQLQNQYDNWRKSRWNDPGHPETTVECRECHMPLVDSRDPARGDEADYNRSAGDGKHRSHRFLAANQFMPLALGLEGAEEQARLTEKWLRGEFEIPEIADKWQPGPAVPLELIVPERVTAGEEVMLQVAITNNKVGHDFPTGPLDIIQAWVELTVTDEAGRVVYQTGQRDERQFIEPGSFIFKAEPVDQYGNLIDRHNLWEMVGVRYRRSLFPGFSDVAEFSFTYPAALLEGGVPAEGSVRASIDGEPTTEHVELAVPPDVTELRVSARLLYRKADQFLLDFLFGEESGITAPVTVLSEDEATIIVEAGN
ncbi:MAG: multiheme c-type cytochrome [Gemmatimonadota bacterium]